MRSSKVKCDRLKQNAALDPKVLLSEAKCGIHKLGPFMYSGSWFHPMQICTVDADFFFFLNVAMHLYKSSCPSVRPSNCPQLFTSTEYGSFWVGKVIEWHCKLWYNELRWSSRFWCIPAVLVFCFLFLPLMLQRQRMPHNDNFGTCMKTVQYNCFHECKKIQRESNNFFSINIWCIERHELNTWQNLKWK